MRRRDHRRQSPLNVVILAALVGAGAVGIAACGSDVASSPTVQVAATPATQPVAATVPVTTTGPAVTVAVSTTSAVPVTTAQPVATEPPSTGGAVTDADIADLEKQLDEIDQLLAGVDADLSQD